MIVLGAWGCGDAARPPEINLEMRSGDPAAASVKADEVGLRLEDVSESLDLPAETRQILTSARQYEAVFGHAPRDIDFEREWAVLYTLGPETSGATPRVRSVSVSSSGNTLLVRTELERPGDGCPGVEAPAFVLVKFPSPAEPPLYARTYHEDRVRHCSGPCAQAACASGQRCLSNAQDQGARCEPVPTAAPSCDEYQCPHFERCALAESAPQCAPIGPVELCATAQCPVGQRCVGAGIHATCIAPDACHRDADCGTGRICVPAFRCRHSNCSAPLVCDAI